MARQHFWGNGWCSKLGALLEDVVHAEPTQVCGSTNPMACEYGSIAIYMKRPWWRAAATLCLFRLMKEAIRFKTLRWFVGRIA